MSRVWTPSEVGVLVAEINASGLMACASPAEQMKAFREAVAILPDEWRGLALQIYTKGMADMALSNSSERYRLVRETVAGGVGVLLLLVGVLIVLLVRDLTDQQSVTCCALIALGSASLLIFLPGVLTLRGVMNPNDFFNRLQVKASGAAAIFIIVFLLLHYALKI